MAASGSSSIAHVGSWGRAHPRTSAVAIALVSFLLGVGAGGSGERSLEADLSAARADARAIAADAGAEIEGLGDDVEDLEERLSTLKAENGELERQITRMNGRRELPDLVGMTEWNALDLESAYGWAATVRYRYASVRAGTVLSQRPAAGTMMSYGAPYTLVVAKPLPQLEDVVGMWAAPAERALGRWNVVVAEEISSERAGRVVRMTPAPGSRLMPGATVTLTVAKKAPPPEVSVDSSADEGCTPGYTPCLPPASDYDCSGGTGDGPRYTGYVTVTGSDPYGLDADGDGAGCES